ncbi:UBX domain protein [Penicillium herquei]|nr:UBX domain protein [Penicillium herquei]
MARFTELQRMDYALPDLDGEGLPSSADNGSRVDSQPGSPASHTMASDLDQLIEMGFDKERAELAVSKTGGLQGALEWLEDNQDKSLEEIKESQTQEAEDDEGPALQPGEEARSLVCNDCGKKFRSHAQAEYHASKTQHVDFSESTEEIAPLTEEQKQQRLTELRERLAAKRAVQSEQDKVDQKRNEQNVNFDSLDLAQAIENSLDLAQATENTDERGHEEKRRASTDRTRQHDLEKEQVLNVFNAYYDNVFAATESDPTELDESSSEDDFDQTLAEEPARKKARSSPVDPINFHGFNNNRKLIYKHDPTKPNPFHSARQNLVPCEPLNQIPEEHESSSLLSPSKEASRKENEKGKNPIGGDPITSARYGQTYEEPGASSSIQDSRNPDPDLWPLNASVEDVLSSSRPTNNVVYDKSPAQLHGARIPGQGDLITFEPSGETLEDRPISSTQPSISTDHSDIRYFRDPTDDEDIYVHPVDMRADIIAASRESFDNAQSSDDSDTCEHEPLDST